MKSAFNRYAPFIKEYIYKNKWDDLREVQVEACDVILDTEKNLIIASGTASGKTEAAFFPILTKLYYERPQSVGILYIGPLKALINDQFKRLSLLLEDINMPVWPWHGDISDASKRKALKENEGIIQITPESLESLIMNRPGDCKRLFSDLRYVVIDEIHALMGEDRGSQIISLLNRLENIIEVSPRRIGLSATLNEYDLACKFLSMGLNRETVAIGLNTGKRKISIASQTFIIPEESEKNKVATEQYNDFIYNQSHSQKCLIFTNSREGAEKVISDMKNIAEKRGDRDVFFVHHGSVSKDLREETETILKSYDGPTVAAATLTLELGIDIGDLDSIIQIGAPYSCASFVQRLGRSGRRTGKSKMLFVNTYEDKHLNSIETMHWILLRTIAIIELYIKERWVEPRYLKSKPFSLLAHQTLSTLMTYNSLMPQELAKRVLSIPIFKDFVTLDEYSDLLKHMIKLEHLERLETGEIIVGLNGEKLAKHFTFFAVFKDEELYHVKSKYGEVGTLENCPTVDEVFILAGRTWKVYEVDEKKKLVFVNLIKNSKVPKWNGTGGDIHTKIVQKMRDILDSDEEYPYLLDSSRSLLDRARNTAKKLNIINEPIIKGKYQTIYICPWVGTKEIKTMNYLFNGAFKFDLSIIKTLQHNHYLQIETPLNVEEIKYKLRSLKIHKEEVDNIILTNRVPELDKYDYMIPNNLLKKAFTHNYLEVESTMEVINNMGI